MDRAVKGILAMMVALTGWLGASAQGTRQQCGDRVSRSDEGTRQMEETRLFLVESVTGGNLYVGQPICYSVKLYSTNPSIEFARPMTRTSFSGLRQVRFPKARTGRTNTVRRETYKGKEYYTVVLDDVMLLAPQAGAYSIKGAEYVIGINEYSLYSDPFWGTVRRLEPSEYPVKAGDMKVKVKDLPPKAPQGFSGAIGEFTVKSVLPEGPIAPNQEATVLFQVKGKGDLREAAIPDVASSFPPTVELKSVARDIRTWQQDDAVKSELTLECTFVPLEAGDIVISPVGFEYFSPAAGKYRSSKSEAVFFSAIRPELPKAPPVIHDV